MELPSHNHLDEHNIPSTARLYLQDDHCFETEAAVLAIKNTEIACDRTRFHPGGGGQPADSGVLILPTGKTIEIESAYADSNEVIWHVCKTEFPPGLVGKTIQLILDKDKRLAIMRYHTVLHVLNTIVLREYGGWITGVQIGTEYSRIDFKLDHFSSTMRSELEEKVNSVLKENHTINSYYISEEEFQHRDDLLRTLEAKPPTVHGQVRVVAIEGFDAQACGGTHMHNTRDVGRFSIYRMDNKGKNNKRFYVRLTAV